jgi:Tannase-like family of unknown function (DUF6351)
MPTIALVLFLEMHVSLGAFAAEPYELHALSSRADAVSGNDVLVELIVPAANSPVRVVLNGQEVGAVFRPTLNPSRSVGLVGGLQIGKNSIEARIGDGVMARLDIVDHPLAGPIFSGPHQVPFACQTDRNGLSKPQDGDCSAQTIISYYYKQQTGGVANVPNPSPVKGFSAPFGSSYGADFKSYDPTKPRPTDIAQTTTSGGRTVDYIVREEIGTINRAVYDIQFLYQPGTPLPTPWTAPTPGWNGRLVYFFGGGCQPGYSQAALTNKPSFAGAFPNELLSQGYAIATSSLNMFGNNCNDRISAETLSMVKEHFIKTFGVPVHTIGSGASGGSMQQHLIAQNYPGLLDGIIPALSFPDITSIITPVVDCSLLRNAFTHAKESWTDDQKAAVAGFATWKTCDTHWIGAENFSPGWVTASNCPATIPKEAVYDRARNPSGVRCDLYDNEVNVYGRDRSTHFARRPLDNSGVQYGLTAFNAAKISAEQFVELNEKIGGFDADGTIVPSRSSADREALRLAYQDGLVNTGGGGLNSVPIIDVRAYMDDSGDFHDSFRSFATRARLSAANGTAKNQVILMAPATELESALLDSKSPYRQITVKAVLQMDQWLDAISRDGSAASPSEKIVKNKPADLVDACWSGAGEKIAEPGTFESTGRCAQLYPIHADPRIAAGAPLADDVLKCALKPLSVRDYGQRLSAAQTSRLRVVFPQGVCDWSRQGVGQQVTHATWRGIPDEPLVQAVAAPSILFDRYTRGWTLAESFYAASALVGWQDIGVGDPLARAYPLKLK